MTRPTDIQLSAALAEVIDLAREIAKDGSEALRRASAGGDPRGAPGYPTTSGGSGGGRPGGSPADPTAAAVLRSMDPEHPRPLEGLDPIRRIGLGIGSDVREARDTLQRAARSVRQLSEGGTGRVSTVELCAGCSQPAPVVKRLDGVAYHHPDSALTCWREAYDRQRPDTGHRGRAA